MINMEFKNFIVDFKDKIKKVQKTIRISYVVYSIVVVSTISSMIFIARFYVMPMCAEQAS